MRVALLHPVPSPGRWSMDIYHDELAASLRGMFGANDSLFSFPGARSKRSLFGKAGQYWQQYVEYGLRARRLKADIFHITDHSYGNIIPFLDQGKIVVTFHDAVLLALEARCLPVKERPLRSIWAQRYALDKIAKVDHIIVDSNFSRCELIKYSGIHEDRISVVHLGIADHYFKAVSEAEKIAFRRARNLPDGLFVLMTGRTSPHKNVEGGLRAFAEYMKRIGAKVYLLKTGSPFSAVQKQLIQELGIAPYVFFLGELSSADLPLVYQCSHVLLSLSFYEGFGLPVLEAMASGVPVVISNSASFPEIAQDAALLADAQNIDVAAENLHRALTNDEFRHSMIEKGRKRAELFPWQETARKTMEIYRKVIS